MFCPFHCSVCTAARDMTTKIGAIVCPKLMREDCTTPGCVVHGTTQSHAAERKATNPKDAVANDHVKFTDLPLRVLAKVAPALSEGAWKYGRHNYRIAGVRATVYVNACLDHLFAWAEGEDIDPGSGFNHIDKAVAGLMVLRDSMLEGNWQDDRAPAVAPGWVEQAHADTKALYERMRTAHGEPKAPFTQANRSAPTTAVEAANAVPTRCVNETRCGKCHGTGTSPAFGDGHLDPCPSCGGTGER